MKVLVDTSVWIDHFRSENRLLSRLLERGQIMTHPLIIGELACGNLKDRSLILSFLHDLPQASDVTVIETLAMIEDRKSFGRGIGLIDFMILAATLVTPDAMIWSNDKRLAREAESMSKSCGPGTP